MLSVESGPRQPMTWTPKGAPDYMAYAADVPGARFTNRWTSIVTWRSPKSSNGALPIGCRSRWKRSPGDGGVPFIGGLGARNGQELSFRSTWPAPHCKSPSRDSRSFSVPRLRGRAGWGSVAGSKPEVLQQLLGAQVAPGGEDRPALLQQSGVVWRRAADLFAERHDLAVEVIELTARTASETLQG